jgi:hypothetical protein
MMFHTMKEDFIRLTSNIENASLNCATELDRAEDLKRENVKVIAFSAHTQEGH